jgi:tryptophan synthase beta chain
MNQAIPNSLRSGPDGRGRFGEFGGRFVAETLMPLILELEAAYEAANWIIILNTMWDGRARSGSPSA